MTSQASGIAGDAFVDRDGQKMFPPHHLLESLQHYVGHVGGNHFAQTYRAGTHAHARAGVRDRTRVSGRRSLG